jgi:wyosine [tRNA(Phe)-imidazoG37] synthetase (radical SAM superfamily)
MSESDKINRDVLGLKQECLYGPVKSRRLKSSLGINVLPADGKLCSFSCIYCQYGLTQKSYHVAEASGIPALPSFDQVEAELATYLKQAPRGIGYITFSGNGEATLHPQFPELVDMVIRLRDRYYPPAKTALLSNSTRMTDRKIRDAVAKLDTPIMKLDAGSKEVFDRINRPAPGIEFDGVVQSLIDFEHPDLIIQALLMGGDRFNATDDEIESWAGLIKQIDPREVHIYSLDRPSAIKSVLKLNRQTLESIADRASEISGVEVLAF